MYEMIRDQYFLQYVYMEIRKLDYELSLTRSDYKNAYQQLSQTKNGQSIACLTHTYIMQSLSDCLSQYVSAFSASKFHLQEEVDNHNK